MNASVLAPNLHTALSEAIHPADDNGKRTTRCKGYTLPVLNHVLITDNEGRLAFYTHDLDKPVVTYAPARTDASFSICVPAHPFLDWMEIIKKENTVVYLTVDSISCLLIVQAGNARATFKCLDAQEFPSIAGAQEPGEKNPTLASVGLAVSKDDARPELKRVCHRDGYMAASDGLRLHLAPSEKTEIPENFPDLSPILASLDAPTYTAIVDGAELLQAVKSLKAVSKAGDNLVTFHCNGSIEISATSTAGDISTTHADLLNSTGGNVEFTLPLSHVLDALTHVLPKQKRVKGHLPAPQTVTIHFTAPAPMAIPAPVWFTNGDLKAAIMPKMDITIPEGTAKPTKSELMSAYNRRRAELKRTGQAWKIRDLNQALGNLQRKNWQAETVSHGASYRLLSDIVKRRAEHTFAIVLYTYAEKG